MKKLNYIIALTAIALTVFSCSTLSVTQKRYSNGLNIAINSKKDEMKSVIAAAERQNAKSEKRLADIKPMPLTATSSTVVEPVLNQISALTTNATPAITKEIAQEVLASAPSQVAEKLVVNSINNQVPKINAVQKLVVKKAVKRAVKNNKSDGDNTILLVILSLILPPLAVYLYEGSWTKRCTINLILTLLCGLPGVIHALIVVLGKN